MNFTSSQKDFLCRHQSLTLDPKFDSGTPSERADLLRKAIAHLQFAKLAQLLEEDAVDKLKQKYEDSYTNIVDSFDEQTGLNNYAEGALAICSSNKNESQYWKCSLTMEKVTAMTCVQKAMNNAKECQKKLLGHHKPTDPLPRSRKETQPPVTTCEPKPSSTLQSKFQFHKTKPDSADTTSNQVMNLYSSKTLDDNASLPRNVTGFGNNRQQNSGPPEDGFHSNRQPVFSSGAKCSAFNQYGGGNQSNRFSREPYGTKRPYQQADEQEDDEKTSKSTNVFRTAKQQLDIDNQRKYSGGGGQNRGSVNTSAYGTQKKSLGPRRGLNSKFVPPVMNREDDDLGNQAANTITRAVLKTGGSTNTGSGVDSLDGLEDERLKGIEPKMIELIMNEIMDCGPPMTWDDVAGLEFAKKTIKEIVVWPMLRPDIFTGLRGPPKGLLLFGPPGTGKTLIGKCIASQSKSTFFCISASSLTSKWVGEGEKMVRALFAVARSRQPAVVFIDEIDSLLTQRTDGENEASRRIKTEFLVQLDGAATSAEDRILVIGATNRPQEIDEAARRRFVKRLYIPLPEYPARRTIITNLLRQQSYVLTDEQLDIICSKTDGFSGADMATLCREAALGPIRDMSFGDIENISADQVRPISFVDFQEALQNVKPSVSDKDLDIYIEWNNTFGSGHR